MSGNVTPILKHPPATTPVQGPLAKLLKHQAIEVLHEQLGAMFASADDTLFDWARNAAGEEQHRCMDLMRVLRVRKSEVVDHFFKAFIQQFDHPKAAVKTGPAAIESSELSMQSDEDLEISIAVSNMTARAEGLSRDQLFDLGLRLDWAAENCGERIEPQTLEPLAVSEAFVSASRIIEMAIESRLVVLKLFERTVMIQLGDFYGRLLQTLDDNGVQAAEVRRAERQAKQESHLTEVASQSPQMSNMLSALGSVAGTQVPQPPNAGYPSAGTNVLPQAYTGAPGAPVGVPPPGARLPNPGYGMPLPQGYAAYAGYTDALLASELSERLSAWLQKPQANAAQAPTAQRADLIGRMFDNYNADPSLPESVKPILETLRFPVLKAALADPSFLSNAKHPLRVLLHDLTITASTARTTGVDPTANIHSLSAEMTPLLTPDAPAVRANIETPAPVSEDEVQAFLGNMDEEAASRRKVIVQRGLQRVDEELKRVVESREMLAAAEVLVDRALRPLLGLTLLRHSSLSPLWEQSLNLAERVVRSVDLARAADISNQARAEVREDLEDAMVLERIPRARSQEAVTSLRGLHNEIESYLEMKGTAPQTAQPKPSAPEPVQSLESHLALEAWYRIYNAKAGTTHWMRLLEHKPKGLLVFGGFDADNRLTILWEDFEKDLISGRSEPLDPPTAYAAALTARRVKAQAH